MTKHIRPVSKAAMTWFDGTSLTKLSTILTLVSSIAPIIEMITSKEDDTASE